MAFIDNLDWLNANTFRAYPFKEDLSRISIDGLFEIPNELIVDMQIAATYDVTRRFYLSKLSNLGDKVILEVSDQNEVLAGTFTITYSSYLQYAEYYFTPTSVYVGASGVLNVGNIDIIQTLPSGIFTFIIDNTEFETRAIIPALKGINRLLFTNADGSSVALTGDVSIVARNNVRWKAVEGQNTVILDAGDGLGLNKDCDALTGCIKTINGIPPDENGNFTFAFTDCASLDPIPAGTGLILSDLCCKPCMGCNDIEELTNRLTVAESALVSLRAYYTTLLNQLTDYKEITSYTCICDS